MLPSTYRRRRCQSDPRDRKSAKVEGPISSVPFPDPNRTAAPNSNTVQTGDTLAEFDDYGTELHKDARVWKVYVKETDKYDADLVKGRNEFLIESTSTLQDDPVKVSARALLSISQTLRTIANETQSVGSLDLPTGTTGSTTFVPSKTAIWLNTPWYLSLSLSLATSFIAILSKDWCHSFMSGRTGDPYSQTCRRQRKWDMLERWKMSELLVVLPSMIHIALLFFSIGLCIQLWDTHVVVALPVIGISALAFGFYACTSIAAMRLDCFPYPTIVSRLCRTKTMGRISHSVCQFATQIIVPNACGLLLLLSYAMLRAFKYFLVIPLFLPALIDGILENPLKKWSTHLTSSSLLVKFFTRPLQQLVYFLIWKPARTTSNLIFGLYRYLTSTESSVASRLTMPKWRLDWSKPNLEFVEEENSSSSGPSNVASLALSWLIKNCEVPQSVDIALQSIAGASKGFVSAPLRDCNAGVEISRRLASSKLYKSNNVETIVSLYSRALSVLGSSTSCCINTIQINPIGDLELAIWDMQMQTERNVADLMTDGQFQPSPHNLAALRIGNTAASRAIQLIKDASHGPAYPFDSIFELLGLHLSLDKLLHSSALLSLSNAAPLLSLCASRTSTPPLLPRQCMKLLRNPQCMGIPRLRMSLVICVLLCNKMAGHGQLLAGKASVYSFLEEALHALIRLQVQDEHKLNIIAQLGLQELSGAPSHYHLGDSTTDIYLARGLGSAPEIVINSATADLSRGAINSNVLEWLQALHTIYRFVQVGAPEKGIYEFVLTIASRHSPSRLQCWQILSKMRFPRLSDLRLTDVGEYLVIDTLVQETGNTNETMQFFAVGQIWLFYTLCLGPDANPAQRDSLLRLLINRTPDSIAEEAANGYHQHLGDLMMDLWTQSSDLIIQSLGVYSYRLMECLQESRNLRISKPIQDALCDVPDTLCGLSSLTDWWARPNNATDSRNSEHEVATVQPLETTPGALLFNPGLPLLGNTTRFLGNHHGANPDQPASPDDNSSKAPGNRFPRNIAHAAQSGTIGSEVPVVEGCTHGVAIRSHKDIGAGSIKPERDSTDGRNKFGPGEDQNGRRKDIGGCSELHGESEAGGLTTDCSRRAGAGGSVIQETANKAEDMTLKGIRKGHTIIDM